MPYVLKTSSGPSTLPYEIDEVSKTFSVMS